MDAPAIDRWLRRRFRHDANLWVALSPLSILGGLLVLFLTFWFAYVAVLLGQELVDALVSIFTGGHFRLRYATRLWLAGGFLAALVIGFLRTKPFHFGESSGLAYFSSNEEQAEIYAKVRESDPIAPAYGRHHPAYPQASAKMFTHLLFTGPRLLFGGWGLLRESARLRTADTAGLAQILAVLAGRDGRVSYEELAALCPDLDFTRAMPALPLLPGIVTLESGLSLTAELRSELRALG